MRLPSIPAKNSDGLRPTESSTSLASNCSDLLRTKCGQCDVPGMSSCRLLIIWQPLQTPSAKVLALAKNAAKSSRARALNRIDLAQPSPAPSTSPSENPPPAASVSKLADD